MIKIEYDVNTGVRVSFVIKDSDEGHPPTVKLCNMDGKRVEGIWQVPQTVETLNIVGRMLNAARRQADTVTVHVPEGAVEEYERRVTAIRRQAEGQM